jgi:hypothetical protein
VTALEQLASNLWIATRPLRLVVGDVGARMTVMGTTDGLLLHSPVDLDDALKSALDELGPVRWIVAPSKAHHLFLAAYDDAYPQAMLCAAPGLPEKRKDLAFDGVLSGPRPSDWPDEVDYVLIEGAPLLNELAFLHRPTRTLVLTDFAFNVRSGPGDRARLFHYLVGATDRFGPHRLIRLAVRDRAAARRSLDHVLGWDFDRVIVSHGEVLTTGGRAAIEAAFSFLER